MIKIFGIAAAIAIATVYGGTVFTILTETADALSAISAALN